MAEKEYIEQDVIINDFKPIGALVKFALMKKYMIVIINLK